MTLATIQSTSSREHRLDFVFTERRHFLRMLEADAGLWTPILPPRRWYLPWVERLMRRYLRLRHRA